MKKIIVGIFSITLLLGASSVFAASIWNTTSNDCRTVTIANHNTQQGFGDPCWPGTSVQANDGEKVSIRIYYHNTGTQNATNTRIVLNAPSGASGYHNFSGYISSDQGGTQSLNVNVSTPSNSTLSWYSTKWLPNRSQSSVTLPSGQDGREVLSGGLNIGTITPGWESQGSVIIIFDVNSPTNPPANIPSGTLTPANNTCSISLGQSSCPINFTWTTINPVGVSAITRDGGPTVANGNADSKAFAVPYGSATFRLYNNGLDLDHKTVTSSCTQGTYWDGVKCAENLNPTYNCSITNFTAGGALSTTISSGSSVNLAWATTNCSYVNITNAGDNLQPTGSLSRSPSTNTTYRLTAYGANGSNDSKSVTVNVTSTPNPTLACSISSFTANGSTATTITQGESVSIDWDTSNCNSLSVSPNGGVSLDSTGSMNLFPNTTTTYRISGSGVVGGSQSKTVKVTVIPATNPTYSCMITDFTADGNVFATSEAGEAVDLSWSTENCYTVSITPNVGTGLQPNNSYTVRPTTTTTYRLTAKGNTGTSVYRNVKVTVTPKVEEKYYCSITKFDADDTSISYGENTRLRWDTDNCYSVSITDVGSGLSESGNRTVSPERPRSYVLTAYGSNGVKQTSSVYIYVGPANQNYNYCSINNFTSNQTYINSGSPVTLSWSTNNCNSVNISGIGSVSTYGSRTITPSGTTNYILTAYGPNGESLMRSVSVIVNSVIYPPVYPPVNPPVYNSCAVTTVATNVNSTSATLNGMISGSSSYTNGYFEYGKTVELGSRTASRSFSGSTTFNETISSLSPYTIYYYRFVSDCQGGVGYGSINIFRTLSSQVTRPIVIQGPTVTGAASPVMLKIENRYETIGRGDYIEYTVTYKNIGSSTLVDPILQVIVPKGITVKNASRGNYDSDTQTLTVQLDDLKAGEEGQIFVQGYVESMPSDTMQVVSTALLVYTNTNSAQENAIAYVLNRPKEFSNGNSLGAAALFSGLFGGTCLIGWLLFIIAILLVILIVRRYFYRPTNNTQIYNGTNSNHLPH